MSKYIQHLMAILVIVMALVLAGALQFSNFYSDNVYGTKRLILKIMLIGYAIYRSVRLWKAIKKEKEDEAIDNF